VRHCGRTRLFAAEAFDGDGEQHHVPEIGGSNTERKRRAGSSTAGRPTPRVQFQIRSNGETSELRQSRLLNVPICSVWEPCWHWRKPNPPDRVQPGGFWANRRPRIRSTGQRLRTREEQAAGDNPCRDQTVHRLSGSTRKKPRSIGQRKAPQGGIPAGRVPRGNASGGVSTVRRCCWPGQRRTAP
jgi:hypothetical protein